MNILICGSRDTTIDAIHHAMRLVQRAHEINAHIIVGDADGIDDAVITLCRKLGASHTIYAPVDRTPRQPKTVRAGQGYYGRDRVMVEACDMCIALWNGVSRGTKYTSDYARKLGKPTHVYTYRIEADQP